MIIESGIYEIRNSKPLGSFSDAFASIASTVQKVQDFSTANKELFTKIANTSKAVQSYTNKKGSTSQAKPVNTIGRSNSIKFYGDIAGLVMGRTRATRKGGIEKELFTAINKIGFDPRTRAQGRGRGLQGLNAINTGTTSPTSTTGSILDLFLPNNAQGLPVATIGHSLDTKSIIGLSAGLAGAMITANLINKLTK